MIRAGLFMCQSDLAPCKDRVLIGDTLYNNYKLLKNKLMSKQYKQQFST